MRPRPPIDLLKVHVDHTKHGIIFTVKVCNFHSTLIGPVMWEFIFFIRVFPELPRGDKGLISLITNLKHNKLIVMHEDILNLKEKGIFMQISE